MPNTTTLITSPNPLDPSHPPLQALQQLAKAVLLLHVSAHVPEPTVFAALTTSAIMVYGLPGWRKAESKARIELLEVEENEEEAETEALDRNIHTFWGVVRYGTREKEAEKEVKELVKGALDEIAKWDKGTGEAMLCALKEASR